MSCCIAAVTYATIGVSDTYFVIPLVNQYVASLMDGNVTSSDKSGLLCRVTRCDAAVAFAAYRPFFVAPRNDVLVFTHSKSLVSVKNTSELYRNYAS